MANYKFSAGTNERYGGVNAARDGVLRDEFALVRGTPQNIELCKSMGCYEFYDTGSAMILVKVNEAQQFGQAFSALSRTPCYSGKDHTCTLWSQGQPGDEYRIVSGESFYHNGRMYDVVKTKVLKQIHHKEDLVGAKFVEVCNCGKWVTLEINDLDNQWEKTIKLFALNEKARTVV